MVDIIYSRWIICLVVTQNRNKCDKHIMCFFIYRLNEWHKYVSRLKDIKKGTLQIDELLKIVKIKVFRNMLFWDEQLIFNDIICQ